MEELSVLGRQTRIFIFSFQSRSGNFKIYFIFQLSSVLVIFFVKNKNCTNWYNLSEFYVIPAAFSFPAAVL